MVRACRASGKLKVNIHWHYIHWDRFVRKKPGRPDFFQHLKTLKCSVLKTFETTFSKIHVKNKNDQQQFIPLRPVRLVSSSTTLHSCVFSFKVFIPVKSTCKWNCYPSHYLQQNQHSLTLLMLWTQFALLLLLRKTGKNHFLAYCKLILAGDDFFMNKFIYNLSPLWSVTAEWLHNRVNSANWSFWTNSPWLVMNIAWQ